jgi:hypothetical protein
LDGPPVAGTLESLIEGPSGAGERGVSPGRARTGPAEARTTTIHLSGAVTPADPVPGRRPGAVPIRDIVGARPRSGRWPARARRTARVGSWLVAAATVSAGLFALWLLLFSTVSGGDVWLGHPLSPAKQDQPARQNAVDPAGSGAASAGPGTAPPKPSAAAASPAAATPKPSAGASSGHGGSGSGSATASGGTPTSGGTGTSGGTSTSGGSGADDPAGDDSGGTSGSGSGSGSSGGSGSGSGSGGHGSDG